MSTIAHYIFTTWRLLPCRLTNLSPWSNHIPQTSWVPLYAITQPPVRLYNKPAGLWVLGSRYCDFSIREPWPPNPSSFMFMFVFLSSFFFPFLHHHNQLCPWTWKGCNRQKYIFYLGWHPHSAPGPKVVLVWNGKWRIPSSGCEGGFMGILWD